MFLLDVHNVDNFFIPHFPTSMMDMRKTLLIPHLPTSHWKPNYPHIPHLVVENWWIGMGKVGENHNIPHFVWDIVGYVSYHHKACYNASQTATGGESCTSTSVIYTQIK